MKQIAMKTTVSVLGAAAASYFGALAAPLIVLLCVMVLDYLTGMAKAYVAAEISSRVGIQGILKKVCYMALVAVGVAADYLVRHALAAVGVAADPQMFCALLVSIWLILNELISILENLAAIGVPGFPWLTRLIERLKNSVESVENEGELK